MADDGAAPLHVFRFHVRFARDGLMPGGKDPVPLCSGAFAECSGLEASMEPKQIRGGGANFGAAQRVGPVSFSTVVLKRGMTSTRDLWTWFSLVSAQAHAVRLSVEVEVQDSAGRAVLTWRLARALPTRFKAADLNARGSEIGVEELHLVHEGLSLVGGA